MSPPAFRVRFPCSRRYAARARRSFRTFLTSAQIDAPIQIELETAVGEAIANALEHAYPEAQFFEIRCAISAGAVIVEIEDDGPGFRDEPFSQVPGATRGFGFGIMRSLSDQVHILKNGRLIRLTKRLQSVPNAATVSPR